MEPQNNGFLYRLTHKTMVISTDEFGNPTKVVEKITNFSMGSFVCANIWSMFYIFTNGQ